MIRFILISICLKNISPIPNPWSMTTLPCKGSSWDFGDGKAIIETPGYPSKYPTKNKCSWEFIVPPSGSFSIDCASFDLESSDYFCVEDTNNWYYNCWHGKYTSRFPIPFPYKPTMMRNAVTVSFWSNEQKTGQGFRFVILLRRFSFYHF